MSIQNLSGYVIPIAAFSFWSITFIESGISKLLDIEGNKSYFVSVFEKTFIKDIIAPTFYLITVLELLSGLTSLIALVLLFIDIKLCIQVGVLSMSICAITILMLFAGQRIAKDYQGASGIVGYFVALMFCIMSLFGK